MTILREDVTFRPKMGGPRKYPLPRIGDSFGDLTVTGYVVGEDGYPHAQDKAILVRCSCGSPEYATKSNWLDSGKLQGCKGCFGARVGSRNSEKWGYQRFFSGADQARSYISRLEAVRRRCYAPHDDRYADYGGRGIRCWWYERRGKGGNWKREMLAYLSTLEGWGDDSLQIDRIDVNGDYAPGNIRLVSVAENIRTRRRVRTVQEENAELKARVRELEMEVARLRARERVDA